MPGPSRPQRESLPQTLGLGSSLAAFELTLLHYQSGRTLHSLLLIAILYVELGSGKIAGIIDDCPGGVSLLVYTVSTQFITTFPWAQNELLGTSEIVIHRIAPIAIVIPGR